MAAGRPTRIGRDLVFRLLSGVLLAAIGSSCSLGNNPGPVESITIGLTPFEYAASIYVAERQGFFAENGLDVTIRDYPTTVSPPNALLTGEVDIAGTTEYTAVGKALDRANIKILGSIDEYHLVYIVGSKDRGIQGVPDLRGRRVGVTRGTIGEFYLGRFLALHNLAMEDIAP